MPTTMKAKDLARLCGLLRGLDTDVAVEHQKGGSTRRLSEIEPTVTTKGSPSVRTIRVVEDGHEKYYAGSYEFEVETIILDGEPHRR